MDKYKKSSEEEKQVGNANSFQIKKIQKKFDQNFSSILRIFSKGY